MAHHFDQHEPWFFETVPPDEFRVSCWQGTTNDHSDTDIREHAHSAVRKIEAASFAGIQLLVFPELYLNGPPLLKTLDSSCDHDVEALEMIANAAGSTGVAVVMGYAKRSHSCTNIYNSAIAFHADGTVAYKCNKVSLATEQEKKLFTPGDEESWKAFDLKVKHRVVRCGICICFDSDFMTSDAPSRIARDGAEVLLIPMAALSTGIDDVLSFDGVAEQNNLYVLRANMAHDDRFKIAHHCGKSCISLKNGQVITKADMKEERHVTYQIKLAETAHPMKVGTKVKVDGLTNATEYNGRFGFVIKAPTPEGRVGIKLDNGKSLAVKLENLEIVT
jgi:predicted amidohydrolase